METQVYIDYLKKLKDLNEFPIETINGEEYVDISILEKTIFLQTTLHNKNFVLLLMFIYSGFINNPFKEDELIDAQTNNFLTVYKYFNTTIYSNIILNFLHLISNYITIDVLNNVKNYKFNLEAESISLNNTEHFISIFYDKLIETNYNKFTNYMTVLLNKLKTKEIAQMQISDVNSFYNEIFQDLLTSFVDEINHASFKTYDINIQNIRDLFLKDFNSLTKEREGYYSKTLQLSDVILDKNTLENPIFQSIKSYYFETSKQTNYKWLNANIDTFYKSLLILCEYSESIKTSLNYEEKNNSIKMLSACCSITIILHDTFTTFSPVFMSLYELAEINHASAFNSSELINMKGGLFYQGVEIVKNILLPNGEQVFVRAVDALGKVIEIEVKTWVQDPSTPGRMVSAFKTIVENNPEIIEPIVAAASASATIATNAASTAATATSAAATALGVSASTLGIGVGVIALVAGAGYVYYYHGESVKQYLGYGSKDKEQPKADTPPNATPPNATPPEDTPPEDTPPNNNDKTDAKIAPPPEGEDTPPEDTTPPENTTPPNADATPPESNGPQSSNTINDRMRNENNLDFALPAPANMEAQPRVDEFNARATNTLAIAPPPNMEAQPRVDEFNARMSNENNLAFALPAPPNMEAQPKVDVFNARMSSENNLAFALPMPSQETMAVHQRVDAFNNWATNFNNNAFAIGQPTQAAPPQSHWISTERQITAPNSNAAVPPLPTTPTDMNSVFSGLTTILTIANFAVKVFNVKIRGQESSEQDAKQFFEQHIKPNIKMDVSPEKLNEMRNLSSSRPNIQALKDLGIDVNASNNGFLNTNVASSDDDGWADDDVDVVAPEPQTQPIQPPQFAQALNVSSMPEATGIFSRPSITIANPNYIPNANKKTNAPVWSPLHTSNENYGVSNPDTARRQRNQAALSSSYSGTSNVNSISSTRTGSKTGGALVKESDLLVYLFNLYDLFILEDNFNLFIKKNTIEQNSTNILRFLYILNVYDYIKKLRNTFIILNDSKSYENLNNYLKHLNDEFKVLFNSFSGGNLIKSNRKNPATIKKNKSKNKKTIRKNRNNKKSLKRKLKKQKKTKNNKN
jgi:hypothetical protein